MKKIIFTIIGELIGLFLIYYIALPIINFKNEGFYIFLLGIALCVLVVVSMFVSKKKLKTANLCTTYDKKCLNQKTGKIYTKKISAQEKFSFNNIFLKYSSTAVISCIILMVIFSLTGATIFNAKRLSNLLEYEVKSTEELNEEFNYESGNIILPQIDKDLAFRLAEARLGDYGSQYTLDYENFTLFSVNRNGKDELIRVAPLEYSNFFVSLNRKNKGTIGYIEVNVVTKEAKLIKFDEGLKYMPSAILDKDLDRKIRFSYPTEMYSDKFFQIDNTGKPFWVIPTYRKKVGMFNGESPKNVITVDPISGETEKYSVGKEPSWIQRALNEVILEKQANYALTYRKGFFNVWLGEKEGVFKLTSGYNYFIKNGQTYFVSCISSPNDSDSTSIGFLAINLKTKEAIQYKFTGITEDRAQQIAENDERVKAQNLTATWPILISFHNTPTYFVILKNDVQPQKIVLINAHDGKLVAMGDTTEDAKTQYEELLSKDNNTTLEKLEVTGIITRIRDLGNTKEFLIEGDDTHYYVVSVSVSLDARFIEIDDKVKITYQQYANYNYVLDIKIME